MFKVVCQNNKTLLRKTKDLNNGEIYYTYQMLLRHKFSPGLAYFKIYV